MLIHCTGLEFPLGLGSIFTLIHCRLHACLNILEIPGLNFKMLNTYMFLLNRTTWPLGWNQWWVLSMFRVFNSLRTPHTSSISLYCFILSFYTIRNAYMSLNIIIRLVCCSWFACPWAYSGIFHGEKGVEGATSHNFVERLVNDWVSDMAHKNYTNFSETRL